MPLNRTRAAELGRETVRILEGGRYATDSGGVVDIADPLRRAVEETRSYPPDYPLPTVIPDDKDTQFGVVNVSTLVAVRRLVDAGHRPAALNFASAKHPGGGFLGGARAQEESLARSSGLYARIAGNPMYAFHSARPDPMYSHYAIYSPDVPVFREDDGQLLPAPFLCSFVTCPAVNAKVVLERRPSRRPEIRDAMRTRIARVLGIVALHTHKTLVLGAWGCGVFGNDCREIAELFREALTSDFRGTFERVVWRCSTRLPNIVSSVRLWRCSVNPISRASKNRAVLRSAAEHERLVTSCQKVAADFVHRAGCE
jgi:uncharacterized protein (TIGR02452 family)